MHSSDYFSNLISQANENKNLNSINVSSTQDISIASNINRLRYGFDRDKVMRND